MDPCSGPVALGLLLWACTDLPDERTARILLANSTVPDFEDLDYSVHPISPLNEEDYCLMPPLLRAVNTGHTQLVRLLVDEHAANINAFYQVLMKSRSSRSEGSVLQLAMDLGLRTLYSYFGSWGSRRSRKLFRQVLDVNAASELETLHFSYPLFHQIAIKNQQT